MSDSSLRSREERHHNERHAGQNHSWNTLLRRPSSFKRRTFDTLIIAGSIAVPAATPGLLNYLRSAVDRTRRIASVCTGALVLAYFGERRLSESAAIQPPVQRRNEAVACEGHRTATGGICTTDDGGWPLLRRGNCQEERFWKSGADAAFVCPSIRTITTGNSTHGRWVDPTSGRSIEA